MTDIVTPTRADIDASDELEENMDGHWTEPMRVFVAKTFARHHLAAEAIQAAEIARLREALKPFAKAADGRKRKDWLGSACFPQPTLLNARAALAHQPGKREAKS